MQQEKSKGNAVKLVKDKLFVNGVEHVPGPAAEHQRQKQDCQQEHINIISWNVNGLLRKLTDLEFINYVQNYDILLLSETWLTKKDHLNFDINGYISEHIFGNKSAGVKKGRYSGGISIYYKNCLKDKIKVLEKRQTGIMWIKFLKTFFRLIKMFTFV